MGVKWTVTLASYTPHPISIALPPVPYPTTSLTSFGMCMEGTVGTRQKRWRCEGVVEHYHKDNLRHLPRFPGFFVTFRILVTLPHPSITPAHIPLSFTSRLEVNEVNGNETGVGEGMENEGVDNRHVTSRSFASHSFHSIIVHTRSPSRHPHGRPSLHSVHIRECNGKEVRPREGRYARVTLRTTHPSFHSSVTVSGTRRDGDGTK